MAPTSASISFRPMAAPALRFDTSGTIDGSVGSEAVTSNAPASNDSASDDGGDQVDVSIDTNN
jgi:hypothetical protein